jgi:hypothetical protein
VSVAPITLEDAKAELNARCNAIEECYEFMLAYAAQGLEGTENSGSTKQVREFLEKCDQALTGLAAFVGRFMAQFQAGTSDKYAAFMGVIERDARDAQAAVQLVTAQSAISSQLVDNLNASIHLRALLTDLFLIDEILKVHRRG